MENLADQSNVLFILLGAIMVLAMHAGFAFLEVGTVREKNQVNALAKIMADFSVSTIAYFFIGYSLAYGINFFDAASALSEKSAYELVKFFFLLTFASFLLFAVVAPKVLVKITSPISIIDILSRWPLGKVLQSLR